MKKRENLLKSIAVTTTAYENLTRTSQLTGLPIGQLATLAIARTFDPKRNPEMAAALDQAQRTIVSAAS